MRHQSFLPRCNRLVLAFAMTCMASCSNRSVGSSNGSSSNSNNPSAFAEASQVSSPTPPSLAPAFGSRLFSFGLLADIQYAPIPDGHSFGGSPRFYRHSLNVARDAAKHFQDCKVDLMVNLGDIVDGKCQDIALYGGDALPDNVDPGDKCIEDVLEALGQYTNGPTLHSYGNHCLYNLSRERLQQRLGIPFTQEPCGDLVGYSVSQCYHNTRFVLLDSYDIALMRRCETTSQKYQQATEILKANNPNFHDNENSPEGMEGIDKRFVAFNGGVGQVQLQWLQRTLEESRRNDEKVIVLSHQPILPDSSGSVCLIWNYEEVLSVLREYSDVVVASLSGHAHKGGYKRDEESGIHFRVVEAALESFPAKTYAIVDVHEKCMSIRGFGDCASAVYDFDHLTGDFEVGDEEQEALQHPIRT